MNDTYQQLAASAYRAMVDRFLSWKLPQDFGPDAGISFTPPPRLPDLYWPTGTNLFHAGQALEMFKHCVELPSAAAVRLAQKNLFDAQEAAKAITKQAIAAEAERDALVLIERRLRRMLCLQRHGVSAYMDDGEATFGGDKFQRPTDYLRESLDSIEQAWIEAGLKQAALDAAASTS